MKNNIKAILFDLNETLIHQTRKDSSHIAYTYSEICRDSWEINFEDFKKAWQLTHSQFSKSLRKGYDLLKVGDFDKAKILLHEPWYRENIKSIASKLNIKLPKKSIEKITWAFQDSWVGGLRMPDNNKAILGRLQKDGFLLGIVTNFQQPDIIDDILDSFGIKSFFQTKIISANFGFRKPHPEIFNNALMELNLKKSPGQVVYVGDNPDEDIYGAQLAGLRSISIKKTNDGSVDQRYITDNINSLDKLPDIINSLMGE